MDAASMTVVLATVVLWGVFATALERASLSAPIVFVAAGFLNAEFSKCLSSTSTVNRSRSS